MSQIAILFRRDRVWLTALVSVLLASVVVGLVLQATQTFRANAFTVAEMTNTGAATATVAIGETDVPIMNVVIPAPAADTLVHDGSGASAAGATFATFDATEQFSDDDHDNAQDYADGALVVNSADTTISAGEIVTSGTADLTSFDTTEGGLEVFADTQTDNNTFDSNEDIYRQQHNGSDVFANDGTTLLEDFAATVMFYDDNTVGDNASYDDTEAIISDADADGMPTAGDSVVTAGEAGVIAFDMGDMVILDDANSDGNYDPGEIIWKDTNASVGSFDAGFDYVLVGAGAATCGGLCTPVQNLVNETGLAYLDDNNDGFYTSARNGNGETIVWFGNAVDPTDGDTLATTVTFFDPAQLADDDINGVWLEDLNAFDPSKDFYAVTSADAAYADGNDIFEIIHDGSQASGDGSEIRTMGANDKFSDADNSSLYTDGELVANSADATLSGAEIVISGTVDVTAFDSSATPYFNYVDDGDSTYEDGEDIYQDDDLSGYLDGDKLTGITVKNTGTAVDADIDELGVWIDDGDGTFESAQDNQVLTDADGTYFDSQESITGTVFTAAQRIFVTVNIDTSGDADGDPTNGATIIAQLTDGATGGDGDCDNSTVDEPACAVLLASNDDGPTDGNITNANTITIDAIVPTPTDGNITATISTDGGTGGIAGLTDVIRVVWDANTDGFTDMASASANLTAFGGGAAVAMAEDDGGATIDCDGDALADADVWCVVLTVSAGAVDAANLNATVTGTDDAGNVSAAVADTSNLSVDNVAPTLTDGAIAVTGASGTAGAFKISDVVTATWDNVADANADEASVTVNYSEFGGGAAVAAADGDANDTWVATYTIVDDATNIDDADNNVSVTVTDDAGNTTTTADGTTYTVDNVTPTFTSLTIEDSDFDGIIDNVAIVFSENIADAAVGSRGFNITSAANHGTCTDESIDPDGTSSLDLSVTCTSAYTAVGDMNISFAASNTMVDDAGNQVETNAAISGASITDGADPVIMSVDPTSGAEGEATDTAVAVTFSEPMDTTFAEGTEFTVTPDATSWTSAASVGNTVITLSHSNEFNCNNTYTVTLDEAQIASANAETLLTTGPEDETWSFQTRSCGGGSGSGGGGGGTVSTTPVVTLSNPDQGDTLEGGEEVNVSWSLSGSGHDTISLAYSTDGGLTYSEIAYNIDKNDSPYAWTVPNMDEEDVIVKITSYDSGKGTLDTDTATVDISASDESATEGEDAESNWQYTEGAEWDESEDRYVAPGSGEMGTSPLDGSEEEISEVSAGWFVRAYGYSSVYYVDESHDRRVFWDTSTFFTWADSWDDVVWVTDATLPTLDMGDAMLPKPGVVLVKIQSDPKVYAIDVDETGAYVLRWIPSEEVAISLYGSDWADYVIDLDSTIFSKFGMGDDMSEDDDVDTSVMKTRVGLAELAQ